MRFRELIGAVILLAACGGDEYGPHDARRFLHAKWKAVSGEIEGVAFTAEVPTNLAENKEIIRGKDWWAGVGIDAMHMEDAEGPRLTLQPLDRSWTNPEELARFVEPDPTRMDLHELAIGTLPGGRLRYASEVKSGSHIDVSVWIPVTPDHGLLCTAHWFWALRHPATPDPSLIIWLDHFCSSVQLR